MLENEIQIEYEYKNSRGYLLNYPSSNKLTLAGSRYGDIKKRCNPLSAFRQKYPTYLDCKNEFFDFQEFAEWSVEQTSHLNKDRSGRFWQVDKDILGCGKIYSPDTCLLVPNRVNVFFAFYNFPIDKNLGSSWCKRERKFIARIGKGTGKGQSYYLGRFDTPEKAHEAWKTEKIKLGFLLSDEFEQVDYKLSEAIYNKIMTLKEDWKL